MNWVSIGLWAVLGFALAASGVGVLEKPWQFFVIMFLVMGIEQAHRFN